MSALFVFEKEDLSIDSYIEELGTTIGEELIKPTKIYTNPVYSLVENFHIKGLCHITGGGFYENIPRILPEGLVAHINTKEIKTPEIFNLLEKWGNIDRDEMYGTFNMGVGMVIVVSKEEIDQVTNYLSGMKEVFYNLGEVKKGNEGVVLWHQ